MEGQFENKYVQVCASCLRASCWYGEFMCEDSLNAGLVIKTIAELRGHGLEHQENWSDDKMNKIYGDKAPFGYKTDYEFRKSSYEKFIQKWGEPLQLVMTIEELAELQKEISKKIRGRKNHNNICEEIADVEIMLEQLILICKIDRVEIEGIKSKKIERALNLIDTE